MVIDIKRKILICADLTLAAVFVILLFVPERLSLWTADSLSFCVEVIIPSLFFFIVLSTFIANRVESIALLGKYIPFGTEAAVIIIGSLAGFPIGAIMTKQLFDNGLFDRRRAEFVCALSNNTSISFVTGVVGIKVFDDKMFGIKMFAVQLAATLITGIILGVVFGLPPYIRRYDGNNCKIKTVTAAGAVVTSVKNMLNICGFIIVFSIIGEFFCSIFRLNGKAEILCRGLFEFSSAAVCCSHIDLTSGAVLTAVILGWSGLSVQLQVNSIVKNSFSLKPYITARVIQSVLMGVLCYILIL